MRCLRGFVAGVVAALALFGATPIQAFPANKVPVLYGALQPTLRVITAGGTAFDSRVTFTRASTATDVGPTGLITSFASGTPRFGYDPVTLAALGYDSEEQRTNSSTQSGNPADASWATAGGAVIKTSTNNLAPDGTNTAALITADGTSAFHGLATPNATLSISTTYASTLFVKSGTSSLVQLTPSGVFSLSYANFSLSGLGSVTSSGGGAVSAAIQAFPNGWYRCTLVWTATSGGFSTPLFGAFITSGTDTRAPTNASVGTLQMWAVQTEVTSANYPGPTSYIPTTTSTVTRAADVASITGVIDASKPGALFATVTPPGDYNQDGIVAMLGVDTNNFVALRKQNSAGNAAGKRWQGQTVVSASYTAQIPISSDGAAVTGKLGYGFNTNDFAFAADNVAIGTDTSGAMPTGTVLTIGVAIGGAIQCNCHIGKLDYYKPKPINSKIQQKTGPTGFNIDLPRIPANDDQPERMAA